MRVAFITLGCKVNSYETDAICDLFVKRGAFIVDSSEEFDACVINTCSVTNQATAKSRKMIRQAIRRNPDAIIAVIGCYSQMDSESVSQIEGVDIVLGNVDKASVVDLIYDCKKNKDIISNVKDILKHKEFENLSPISFNRTRAFLKIEDGCNNFCSYCIIPYTRGPIRSKPVEDVNNEINKIVANGYHEVVLTGIHTGKYRDGEVDFTALIRRILAETNVKRLRISSIELNEITDEFLLMMKESDVLADHLHLPLQAGSSKVLKAMNRHYTKEEFIDKVKKIREVRPNISITTDIIVGFPEETYEDFLDTIDVSKKCGFAHIHAFPYSMRKGTKACLMKQVNDQEKNKRMEELLTLDIKLQEEYYQKFIGTKHKVIIEDLHGDYYLGHTSNFLPVLIPFEEGIEGKMIEIIITEIINNKIFGKICI